VTTAAKTRNPYGHFDDENREYVITRPDTPLPWWNYLGCEDYFGIISHTAGGYSFYRDARLRRIMRYRYNDVPLDNNGRFIYVKDGNEIWNPSWKPTRTDLKRYECRHGVGYTRITGRKKGVEVSVNYFVPLGRTQEIWDVTVTNHSKRDKNLKLFGFVEWCLWEANDDMTNFQRNFSTGQVEVVDGTIFHVTEYRERRDHYAYFTCSRRPTAYDTSRNAFVGVHDGLDAPHAVVKGKCTNSVAHGWHPVGGLQVNLPLKPGTSKRFHFVVGYVENPANQKFEKPGVVNKKPYRKQMADLKVSRDVDREFDKLCNYWRNQFDIYRVDVDDPHVSRMVNVWNQVQCMTTLNLSRSASGYESGIGRGMGYRDSNQDVLGVVHLEPARCRQRLLELAATQLSDGTCYHQFQPLTKQGNANAGSGFNDDPLWLCLSTAAYIKETGDLSVLDERIGCADQPAPGNVGHEATLLDHLEISLNYTLNNRGPHGLPLIGHADWNDCLNLNCFSETPGESFQLAGDIGGSVAESVMIAGLFCKACEDTAGIYRLRDDYGNADRLMAHRADMQRVIGEHGWDGEWFRRAYDAAGQPLGSKQCAEGRIFIESQGWCILGGVGLDDGRAATALQSVNKHLATQNGVILQQPAYSTYHKQWGEITSYPPGYKENAGIFTHNNTWIQIAETLVGNGDRAYDYYMSICPSTKQQQIDTYRCEPYVYSQMTAGPDAATFGEAKNSWLTGTAAWSFVAISQHILGVQPDFHGLRIDPCIPRKWKKYAVQRRFRGKTYNITVHNPDKVCRGVKSVTVNSRPIDGNLIPLDLAGDSFEVEVTLG
jgi:cellobiose phosphorylase